MIDEADTDRASLTQERKVDIGRSGGSQRKEEGEPSRRKFLLVCSSFVSKPLVYREVGVYSGQTRCDDGVRFFGGTLFDLGYFRDHRGGDETTESIDRIGRIAEDRLIGDEI